MTQVTQYLDVLMLDENKDVILSLMQQSGFPTIESVYFALKHFGSNAYPHIVMHIIEKHPLYNYHDYITFFKDKMKMEIEIIGIDQVEIIRSFKILSAEVSEVKITQTYEICTVQSVLAAAVQTEHAISASDIPGVKSVVEFFATISMPELESIEDITRDIAWEKYDDAAMHSGGREMGVMSVETRWIR